MNRERLELTRSAWGFNLMESIYWSWLASCYWRLLHGRTLSVTGSGESRPDVSEGSR